MKRGLCLSLGELPRRARPLSEKEIEQVFGGCIKAGECDPNVNCQCCGFSQCKFWDGYGPWITYTCQ